jgi:TetR/AcrR family transcriptional repressor of bet genes
MAVPKLGMEPIRRDALVKATIAEVGRAGSLDVTVGQIARAAGMSPALAHHYFGGKEEMFLAAMRHVLRLYGAEVRAALAAAAGRGARARFSAILEASFSPANFQREVVGAWLNFWVMASSVPGARRLLVVYQRRLRSNLLVALRPLAGAEAGRLADAVGAMIDGVYLREVLRDGPPDSASAVAMIEAQLDAELAAAAAAAAVREAAGRGGCDAR